MTFFAPIDPHDVKQRFRMRAHCIDIGLVDAAVIVVLAKIIQHREVVIAEFLGLGLRPERMTSKRDERLFSKCQRPFEHFTLSHMRTDIFQFVNVVAIPCTRQDLDLRIGLGDMLDNKRLLVPVIDRCDEEIRFPDPGPMKEIGPRGIAIESSNAHLAEVFNRLRVVVKNDNVVTAGQQKPSDDLTEASHANDHHAALAVDDIRFPVRPRGSPWRDHLFVENEQRRCQQHRNCHDQGHGLQEALLEGT